MNADEYSPAGLTFSSVEMAGNKSVFTCTGKLVVLEEGERWQSA